MRTGVLAALVLAAALPAFAQSADNVLVVINEKSITSAQIGEYYIRKRAIAQDHVVRIQCSGADAVPRQEYEAAIETPISQWLTRHALQDKILYIVLTKGVPLRATGTEGRNGTTASVDSELALLYRKMVGTPFPLVDRVANPYFLDEKPVAEAKPFTRFVADIFLVTRLDGFSIDDVLKLIDRGSVPEKSGKVLLDEKASAGDPSADRWLEAAADRLTAAGLKDRVVLENTPAQATSDAPLLGYYSWGSNDRQPTRRRSGLTFAAGAIGGSFVSTDGRTFAEPPADWMPSGPNGGPKFGGTFQSLSGDLIRDGITGVSGHVAEPFLDATIHPQVLFPAYFAGFNLAESFYLAMPFLSWQTVIIGDPLCAPFRTKTLTSNEIAKGIDPDTELPALFSERRLAWLARGGFNPEAVKLLLKLDGQVAREDRTHIEEYLLKATAIEPRMTLALMRLAVLYEERGDYEKAIGVYRNVIAVDPKDATALNNLAYALAEYHDAFKEALPLAERAYALAPAPTVADTLAWVQHKSGDDKSAGLLIEKAVAAAPGIFEIQLHAAAIHTALGDLVKARKELDAALKIDPKAADRSDVKALQTKLR